jgi:hypothetical protein
MSLLDQQDIFITIIREWIELKDLLHLDSALTMKAKRDNFVNMLSNVPFEIPYQNNSSSYWQNLQPFLLWVAKRRIYDLRGSLKVHSKLWQRLFHSSDEVFLRLENDGKRLIPSSQLFLPLLKSLKQLEFVNYSDGFTSNMLNDCSSLTELAFVNYSLPRKTQQVAQSIANKLRRMELHNSAVSTPLLCQFLSCPELKEILFDNCWLPAEIVIDVARPFLQKLKSISISANICAFFTQFFHLNGVEYHQEEKSNKSPQRFNLQNILLDNRLEHTEVPTASIYSLCETVSDLRVLDLRRMTVFVPQLFSGFSVFNPNLEKLSLNQCHLIFSEVENNQISESSVFSFPSISHEFIFSFPLASLEMNNILAFNDRTFEEFFNLFSFNNNSRFKTNASVTVLKLVFCLKSIQRIQHCLSLILITFPFLQSLEIEDKREVFFPKRNDDSTDNGRGELLKDIIEMFVHLPNFRVSAWPEWMPEAEKATRIQEREILFERFTKF